MKSKLITILCVSVSLFGFALRAGLAQQSKAVTAPKTPSTAPGKNQHVVVFSLSGTPAPGPQKQEPKDLPHFRPLSKEEKLAIALDVPGIPKLSLASVTPYLRLSPSHMAEVQPWGWLTLAWPDLINVGLAHYTLSISPNGENGPDADALAGDEQVEINFKADGGNVYMVDFFVDVVRVSNYDTGKRDFQLTISGQPPSSQSAMNGDNHLLGVFYVPADGYYTARLQIQPATNTQPSRSLGPWFFLEVEVTKFVPQS